MLINWFTVFAQILNFLILVALLRWLLYKPILQVMEKRQQKLLAQWQEAEQLQTEAAAALALYQQQQEQWQSQQSDLSKEAHNAANQERQRQLEKLQQEIAEQRRAWQDNLQQEQNELLAILQQRIIQQTMVIARQGLRDLANGNLEEQMVLSFCEKLRHLDQDQQEMIKQALAQSSEIILVKTSFAMSPILRQQLQEALQTIFQITQTIGTEISPHLLCGIELQLAGQEIVWSLDSYLRGLGQKILA